MKIKILAPQEAQKIAAGEVVERPANVVKELLENALDAQATKITIYISEGGKKLIRIIDNGTGMSPEDARICILPHATSKITIVEELNSISTFGFRGEALASVASVSHMQLITKHTHAAEATQLTITAGEIAEETTVAANTGTDITIKELFYNVPARQKFLKTEKTEWYAIQQLVHAYALAYPQLHISLYHNQNMTINCPPATTLRQRCEQLFEVTTTQHLLDVQEEDADTKTTLTGVITNHQYGRYDRSNIYFMVNGRWVKNYKLSSALTKGYQGVLRDGQFPCAVISITVPQHTIDINIHPRKEEVQFLHPRKIELMLQNTVHKLLNEHIVAQLQQDLGSINSPGGHSAWHGQSLEPHVPTYAPTHARAQELSAPYFPAHESHIPVTQVPYDWQKSTPELAPELNAATITYTQQPLLQETTSQELQQNYMLLGQLKQTYIILETDAGLMMVDQHAAHERVLYEQIGAQLAQAESIKLLFPEIITLPASSTHHPLILPVLRSLGVVGSEIELLANLAQDFGIEIEPFGQNQLRVSATPVYVKPHMLKDIILNMAQELSMTGALDPQTARKQMAHKLQAMIACKAAVKAHDVLNEAEMHQLIKQLLATPNRLTCPHGRPTSWVISTYDLERRFKRVL